MYGVVIIILCSEYSVLSFRFPGKGTSKFPACLQVVASVHWDGICKVDWQQLAKPALPLSWGLGVNTTAWMHPVPHIRHRTRVQGPLGDQGCAEGGGIPPESRLGTLPGVALQGLALCLTSAPHGGPEWPHQWPVALLEMQVAFWWEFRHPEELIAPWPGTGGGLPNGSWRLRKIVLTQNILLEQEGTLNSTGRAF